MQSAGQHPVTGEDALSTLDGISDLYVARGRRVLHFDLVRDRPSDAELLEMMLGRSGKLRAPTLKVGSRLIVGCNEELLRTTLL